MADAFLRVQDVTKRFGAATALDGVSLDAGRDELLVVLGPTGAGKTTLLRVIAGLETPDAGRVEMEGRDVTAWPPARRDVALVFQNFSLYPRWTVRRNLEFPLRAPGRALDEQEIRRRVEWAAELLHIADALDRGVTRLSGGQMQRVAIGRAIVRRPRLFLLDEPLTNLDAKLREELRVELIRLRRELRAPMIFVTHDQAEALSMADRLVLLSEGRVLQSGPPAEVYRRPASPAAALLLGQPRINLLRAARREGRWVLPNGETLWPAEEAGPDACVFGVRPEDIEVEGGERPARVQVAQDMGPHKILLAEWLGQPLHILAPPGSAARPGDVIRPRIRRERVVAWPDAPRAQ